MASLAQPPRARSIKPADLCAANFADPRCPNCCIKEKKDMRGGLLSIFLAIALLGCDDIAVASWPFGSDRAVTDEAADKFAAALKAASDEPAVTRFYEARGWRAAWSEDEARHLMESLKEAERHGMDSAHFMDMIAKERDAAAHDAGLTRAALSYADALANGLVDPSKIHESYTLPRNKVDVAAGLSTALEAGNISRWLAGLAPKDPEYEALSEAYLRFKKRSAERADASIANGSLIRAGSRDPRVQAIAEALTEAGYYRADAGAATDIFTPEMAAAVEALQAEHGLKPDGIVGVDTIGILNVGPADRARQLAINLERRRWLSRDLPATRIDVNTAATRLTYFVDGKVAWTSKVINGQPSTPTPQLGSPLFQLVVNPPWHVPKSIAEKEILPKGPEYMRRSNMAMKEDGQIVQAPGPNSALGQVKFDLKNDNAIYLHDTPSKKLFAQDERHLSHGCVRVENPLELARMLAAANGKTEQFETALASGETKYILLERQVPVRLLYHTAFVDEGGAVTFRSDVYGWDEAVARAVGMEPGGERSLFAADADFGP
jgi:murein L,D-transpeptidase YcbB/YkuD